MRHGLYSKDAGIVSFLPLTAPAAPLACYFLNEKKRRQVAPFKEGVVQKIRLPVRSVETNTMCYWSF
jgi:hypothetical protein